jgi:hypothetical protein
MKDPIRFGGGSSNLYGYVVNDPINRIDLMGTSDSTCAKQEMCEPTCYQKYQDALGSPEAAAVFQECFNAAQSSLGPNIRQLLPWWTQLSDLVDSIQLCWREVNSAAASFYDVCLAQCEANRGR